MKNALRTGREIPTSLLSFWMRSGGRWASVLTLCLVVAAVIMACGADSKSTTGASSGVPAPSVVVPASGTPTSLRASYIANQQKRGGAAYEFEAAPSGATGKNATHELEIGVAGGATTLARRADASSPGWHLGLQWTGLGRGEAMAPVAQPKNAADVAGNRATYVREDDSQEWYENGPLGLEQGFVLPAPPAGSRSEALAIELSLRGDLAPSLASGSSKVELRDAHGKAAAHYTDLAAFDASGAELHSWLEVRGAVIRLRIEDATARYPVTIDPIVWTALPELTAGDDAAGDWFGFSVSVSGTFAIVGAPNHAVSGKAGAGAAYIFEQSGTSWSEVKEISAGDATAGDGFGSSVSIDGTLAIVGAPFHEVGTTATTAGSAYVFADGVTGWTETQELTAGDAAIGDNYGTSVALSVSGTTAAAIVGAPNHASNSLTNSGSAYIYGQGATSWALQQEVSAFTDGASGGAASDAFGTSVSVSVSASSSYAIVGAPYHTVGSATETGAAYLFSVSDTGTWPFLQNITAPTSGTNAGVAFDAFGTSVSISGTTAFVGAPNHAVSGHDEAGSVYVFGQGAASATWSESQMLVASDPAVGAQFGSSVNVSGINAIVGSYLHDGVGAADAGVDDEGTAYVFYLCSTWNQQQELEEATGTGFTTPAPSDFFGYSVAISGSNAFVGAYGVEVGTNLSAGGSYVFDGSGCCISSTAYNSGATDPGNSCEVCTPATSTTGWSNEPDGTSCNSGTEVCSAGTCVADCNIGGTLYASGVVNTANPCQVCTPGTSTTSWSNVNNGTTCNDGVSCSTNDVCTNGTCGGTPYTCTPTVCQATSVCNGTGTCTTTSLANGTVCGADEECESGVCVAVTADAGARDAGNESTDAGERDSGSGEHDAGSPVDSGITDGGTTERDASVSADAAAPTDAATANDGSSSTGEDSGTLSSEDSGVVVVTEDAGSGVSEDGGIVIVVPDDGGAFNTEDASTDAASGNGGSGTVGEGSGCGCTVVGSSDSDTHALLGAFGLVLIAVRRRRRK